MSTGGKYLSLPGLTATGDLSSKQYMVVQAASTAGAVKLATTAATDLLLGVLQNDPTSGQAAEVAFAGVCQALSEDSVTFGSYLTCSTTGRVKTTTTDGDEIVGFALRAGDAGDKIPVMLKRCERASTA
jgi:hypothetical protein